MLQIKHASLHSTLKSPLKAFCRWDVYKYSSMRFHWQHKSRSKIQNSMKKLSQNNIIWYSTESQILCICVIMRRQQTMYIQTTNLDTGVRVKPQHTAGKMTWLGLRQATVACKDARLIIHHQIAELVIVDPATAISVNIRYHIINVLLCQIISQIL